MNYDVEIINRLRDDFGMVPNGVWRSPLSFKAKGVACYLFSLRGKYLPYVKEIERATGLGKDARQAAFAELKAFGAIQFEDVRGQGGAILRRKCILNWQVFVSLPEEPELVDKPEPEQEPENPAPVENTENRQEPEKPAPVKPAPPQPEIRRTTAGKSGEYIRERRKKGAPPPRPDKLHPFLRSQILADRLVVIDGTPIRPGSPEMEAMRKVLREGAGPSAACG